MSSLGDPWDTISFLDKKRFGLHYYYTSIVANPLYGCQPQALIYAAEMVRVSPRTIFAWVTEYEGEGDIKPDARGKSAPMVSPMQDEEFRSSLKEFVPGRMRLMRKQRKHRSGMLHSDEQESSRGKGAFKKSRVEKVESFVNNRQS